MTSTARPAPQKRTVSKVVETPKTRVLKPLTKSEILQDRSVGDFCKWIRNFGHQGSGHFATFEDCDQFASRVETKITVALEGFVDESNIKEFVNWIVMNHELFVSPDASHDFARQAVNYVELDDYIGVKPT